MGPLQDFTSWILQLISEWGGYGVFVGMILESSIIPIPSEAILVTAGLAGIDPVTVGLAGGLGSTIGAAVGYLIGKEGRVFVDRYGKYILVTNERVSNAEGWFKRWGNWTILISRLLPLVPYKVFSIAAGLLRMNYKPFITLTLIGSVPRCFLLAWLGNMIIQAEYEVLAIVGILIIALVTGHHAVNRYVRLRRT